ncbi:MAG: SoxR reducing system RseC family protein [Bacteroidales bacterium]|nr:SoxR reducing system RseC family protein [Bacteroidales bacterium]
MNPSVCIEQTGIVEGSGDGVVHVKIFPVSACSDCHSKASCSLFGNTERIIDVTNNTGEFRRGDRVGITITQSMGNKAIAFGYFVPFLLVLLTLIALTVFRLKEWQAGLIAISTLIPYYIILYFFRTKLGKTFTFTLKKLE